MCSDRRLMDRMRQRCLEKGLHGIKGLCVFFRKLDIDYSKSISFEEFLEGMQKYGMGLTPQEVWQVFSRMDRDGSGRVDFAEFLRELRPPMAPCRISVVNEAFDKLDVVRDNKLKVDDLEIVYRKHAEAHPNFRSGRWTMEQTLENFLDAFDTPDDKDGIVTRDEFLNYYASVSSTIDDDAYFDLMMRSSWGLPQKGSAP